MHSYSIQSSDSQLIDEKVTIRTAKVWQAVISHNAMLFDDNSLL